ncbi:prepilin-type N-terminal cleavage/methylation domain-containing protein [bacterium]|nr:prepilin-type N-terminal cleavage/methylation domain-containing protein [bacterium]
MKRNRAFSLLEVMVASGVLLVMVTMTSMATLSYLKAYRHYTGEGLKLRQTAKTLEVLCSHLRSARSLQLPIPASLKQSPLTFEKRNRQQCSLQVLDGQLMLAQDKESIKVGAASDIHLQVEKDLLHVSIVVAGQSPVQTAISLRGVRR